MSKLIKPTNEAIEKLKSDFIEALNKMKWENGKINFQANLGTVDRKATVFFTDLAWRKMQALVADFNSEIGWHGVAYRDEDDTKDNYYITDILVYPQEVTGATVTTDQEEYQMWLMSHDDDVFNNIRMQGHSHVNMSTSPSSVDWNLYKSILDQLEDDMFYIFMIWNKSNSRTIMIYDMKKNILFETADVTVKCHDEDGFLAFMADAKEKVKTKPSTYSTYTSKPNTTAGNQSASVTNNKVANNKSGIQKQNSKSNNNYPYNYNMWDSDWDDDYSYYGYGRRSYK